MMMGRSVPQVVKTLIIGPGVSHIGAQIGTFILVSNPEVSLFQLSLNISYHRASFL